VVTHHLPHAMSIHEKYQRSALNPAFASDLSELVCAPVALWIHGHTHESMDYTLAGTRVVCNPRGYLPDEPNPGFEAGLVVELV
jgi:Icc-related predicted phosphoesterase